MKRKKFIQTYSTIAVGAALLPNIAFSELNREKNHFLQLKRAVDPQSQTQQHT